MQMTVAQDVHFKGTGLHSGRPVHLIVRPAPRNHGIVFRRSDLGEAGGLLPALWDQAEQSPLCTKLVNPQGTEVSTIEHLMAALAGLGITNVLVDVNAPEVPILDGSAAPFVRKLLAGGLARQAGPLYVLRILKPVTVTRGAASATLSPSTGFTINFEIDFTDKAIGQQEFSLNMRNGAFVRNLCDSRTFCSQSDVDKMREAGLALGGTPENAVVFDGDAVLSPGGLRHKDEPVRHKMLDALGDLALAGMPIQGLYTGVRAGHSLTNQLLHAVFADPEAYEVVECDAGMARELPGVGVRVSDLALCA